MNKNLLLLTKKHNNTFIDQKKTKPQEMLDYEMKQQMQTFSFNPPINLAEEGRWLLAVTSFETKNSIFNVNDETNSFWISTPVIWSSEGTGEIIDKLNEILELRSHNDIELHIIVYEKRRTRIEIENSGYNLAGFDHFESEILAEVKRVKYRDLGAMSNRMEVPNDEFVDILDIKCIVVSTNGYTWPPGIYESIDLILMLKSLLPNEVKVNFTLTISH